MIDPKSLLAEVQKMLTGVPPEEIMAGIKEFMKSHPDASNQDAIQALGTYLDQQKQSSPKGKPFEGLIGQLGAR